MAIFGGNVYTIVTEDNIFYGVDADSMGEFMCNLTNDGEIILDFFEDVGI